MVWLSHKLTSRDSQSRFFFNQPYHKKQGFILIKLKY
jgi:hypothetical protein